MAATADCILKLNQQRLELIDVVNNLVDETDKLDSSATLDDVVKRLKTIDTLSILQSYIQPSVVNPNNDWSIDDTKGKIKSLREWAFYLHRGLRSINLPQCTIVKIGAFSECSALEKAVISGANLHIYGNAFQNCSSLISLSFPRLSIIEGEYVFNGCASLKSITFNKSGSATVKSGYNPMNGCTNLQALVFPSKDDITKIEGYYLDFFRNNSSVLFYIPKCMKFQYSEAWMSEFVTADRVKCLEDYDFEDKKYTNNRDYLINKFSTDLSDYEIVEYVPPDVRSELERYASGALIATINGRNYTKSNWGSAIVCVIKLGDNYGSLLVSTNKDCVTFYAGSTVSSNTKFQYNNETYYCSGRSNFVGSNPTVVSDYPLLNDITGKTYTNDEAGSIAAAKDLLDYYFKKI